MISDKLWMSLRPTPHAPCPMRYAPCPTRHALCPMPYAPCAMPHALYAMRYAPCPMRHAPCAMPTNPRGVKQFQSEFQNLKSSIERHVTPNQKTDDRRQTTEVRYQKSLICASPRSALRPMPYAPCALPFALCPQNCTV